MILYTNVNVSGFVKAGMKLFITETHVTRNAIREISLNMQDFTFVRLPTQGMTKLPSWNSVMVCRSLELFGHKISATATKHSFTNHHLSKTWNDSCTTATGIHFALRLRTAYSQQRYPLPRLACGLLYGQARISKFRDCSDTETLLPSTFLVVREAFGNAVAHSLCHGHVAGNMMRSVLAGPNHDPWQ
jgi:hypothetical protein